MSETTHLAIAGPPSKVTNLAMRSSALLCDFQNQIAIALRPHRPVAEIGQTIAMNVALAVRVCCLGVIAASLSLSSASGGSYFGQVSGVPEGDNFEDALVLLTSEAVLESTTPDPTGRFAFYGLADGDYLIQVRKPGYKSSPSRPFRVTDGGSVSSTSAENEFSLERLNSNAFVFHWEEDQSTTGFDYSSNVNQPIKVDTYADQDAVTDAASAEHLLRYYNITLVDSEENRWTHEHAYRLWQTMEQIPQRKRDSYDEQSLPASRWFLVSDHMPDDIQFDADTNGIRSVRISVEAFVYATPKLARVEGKRGRYYSKRLHHALVRFATDNGHDVDAYERILEDRFGVTTRVADHTTYERLTAGTTQESAWMFQDFHPDEIVEIINTLEEMPQGMRTTAGLEYLVRRRNGSPHPLHRRAPAVAWTQSGYIEFMESAFKDSSIESIHRLIIHEKAHFLWAFLFKEQLKAEWVALGGWYRNANESSGWSTTKQTEFVSAYAHSENPNEDMAESVAYFVTNPDKLRSRSPAKYEFIRDRIMQGNIYIPTIREDLTFEVYNLYPDYVYPGRIRRVDIKVTGDPGEDKEVSIEIEIHATDRALEGATHAYTRIFSEVGTFTDLYLYPIAGRGQTGTVLIGSFTLSRYAKAGFWSPDQIGISDSVGNERFAGIDDFGWRLYVNNPHEDLTPPRYVPNSISLSLLDEVVEGRAVQVIETAWRVEEQSGITDCAGDMIVESTGLSRSDQYRYSYGFGLDFPYQYDPKVSLCKAWRIAPDWMPSGKYVVVHINMTDRAGNWADVKFRHSTNRSDDPYFVNEPAPVIELKTKTPDVEPPELDLNTISIHAEPTVPEAPNGETQVTLKYRIRDNISGVTSAGIYLRDPQGINHHHQMHPKDGYLYGSTWHPSVDPSQWSDETFTVLLPKGSAPGVWGVYEIGIWDRANNISKYNFSEIVHFEVD